MNNYYILTYNSFPFQFFKFVDHKLLTKILGEQYLKGYISSTDEDKMNNFINLINNGFDSILIKNKSLNATVYSFANTFINESNIFFIKFNNTMRIQLEKHNNGLFYNRDFRFYLDLTQNQTKISNQINYEIKSLYGFHYYLFSSNEKETITQFCNYVNAQIILSQLKSF